MKEREKFVCLMSSGTDSPVACYTMIEKGFIPILLHFHLASSDFQADEILKQGIFEIIKILKNYVDLPIKTYFIPHRIILAKLKNANLGRIICIICRRLMYRIARAIAIKEDARAIVTGESLGEKASQTPMNLFVMKQAVHDFLIIQPLIALNKLEIEDIAKNIGTYEASIQKSYVCTFAPKYPMTYANLEKTKELEKKINIQKMIDKSLKHSKIMTF